MEKQEDRERGYKDITIPNTDSQQLLMPVLAATAHACIGSSYSCLFGSNCSCLYRVCIRMDRPAVRHERRKGSRPKALLLNYLLLTD